MPTQADMPSILPLYQRDAALVALRDPGQGVGAQLGRRRRSGCPSGPAVPTGGGLAALDEGEGFRLQQRLAGEVPPLVSIHTQLPMLRAVDRIDPAGPTFSMLR